MVSSRWSFASGILLAASCVIVGLWANMTIYGDLLATAEISNPGIDAITILLTTVFLGLSGGHYIGGSFSDDGNARWFALGANLVLWVVIIGIIWFRATSGDEMVQSAIYGAALFTIGGTIFSLHNSELIEDESQIDEYIGLFSTQGTALVVVSSFIVRTAPDPATTSLVVVVISVVSVLLWRAYGEEIEEGLDWAEEALDELRTAEKDSAEESD